MCVCVYFSMLSISWLCIKHALSSAFLLLCSCSLLCVFGAWLACNHGSVSSFVAPLFWRSYYCRSDLVVRGLRGARPDDTRTVVIIAVGSMEGADIHLVVFFVFLNIKWSIFQAIHVEGYRAQRESAPWSSIDHRVYLRDHLWTPAPDLSLEVWVLSPYFLSF